MRNALLFVDEYNEDVFSPHGTHFAVIAGTHVPLKSILLGQVCFCEVNGVLTVYYRNDETMGKWTFVCLNVFLFGRRVCLIILLYILKNHVGFLHLSKSRYMIQYGKGNLTWNTFAGKVRGVGVKMSVEKTHPGLPRSGRILTNLVPWLNRSSDYPWAEIYTTWKPPTGN